MKRISLLLLFLASAIAQVGAQSCPTCGNLGANNSQGNDNGVSLRIFMGTSQYGQSAGQLTLNGSLPDPGLFTPVALSFSAPNRPDVTMVTTNIVITNAVTQTTVGSGVIFATNILYFTNYDGVSTNVTTYTNLSLTVVTTTNSVTTYTLTPKAVIRQVNAPQALADIPAPQTTNGYIINFYYPTQVGGMNADGTYQVSGTPFITWIVTNSSLSGTFQLQISEIDNVPNYGLMKQWTYAYATNTGTWSMQTQGGIQENMNQISLNSTSYQVINTLQYSDGPVVQQNKTTYSIFSWGTAPTQIAVGSDSAPEVTTYTYPSIPNAGSQTLVKTVTHPDGSWEYYNSYDSNGNPLQVDFSFGDSANGRETDYTYTTNVVSGSGDIGVLNPDTARRVIQYAQGQEVSRSYTVFQSAQIRLDIKCTTLGTGGTGAAWNDLNNLVTTNLFYTNGPNQFMLQAVIRPDGTATTYNYITNGTYQTNITVTGQPDSTLTNIVDGVSNVTVLNLNGYTVFAASYDVLTGDTLSRDTYGNFDSYGRAQQVTHLDGTTETMQYTCCGLDNTVDRDGVTTAYLYDADKRQIGYAKYVNGIANNPITHQNVLDAAGRNLQSIRIGSDNSYITLGQSAYDQAGELIAQTNALGGSTSYNRINDLVTGGVIQTIIYPNGGACTNFYYADGSLKKTIGTAVHGITNVIGVENVSGVYQLYSQEIKLNADGSPSSEWTKTYTDFAGRTYKTVYSSASGTPTSISYYNSKGQLTNQIDPDGVSTFYQYNAKGELAYTAVDLNRNGVIDFNGTDRITWTTNDVTTDYGMNVRRTRTYVWGANGVDSSTLISATETSTDGLNTWQTQYRDANTPVTTHIQTIPGSSRVVTTMAPDNSYTINTYSYGRLISSTRYDSTPTQIGGTTYSYDPHGRQSTVTDARNGATTYIYNNADLVNSVTTPVPGNGQSAEVTTTLYDNMLRPWKTIQPDNSAVTNVYLLTGELGLQYGSRTYPVGYSFDYAGRMKTMTNWSNYSGGSGTRVTTWKYDGYRGFLTNKVYDGSVVGPSYTYTVAGRLQTRKWARGITTTYSINNAGDIATVVYSDGKTPNMTYSYDRLGRKSTIVCNGITNTLAYNLANELLSESYSNGILNGLSVTNGYDANLRRTSLALISQLSTLSSTAYGYDNASRLQTVSDGNNNSATYSYLANSPLVSQITFKSNSVTRMTTSKTYDYLNRLTAISSSGSAGVPPAISFNYNYNPANQRTRNALADGSYWIYSYDSLGQVTGANKYWRDGTPVAGQQFDYTFDTIGNRTQTQTGGDQNGANLRPANYYANNLNQITNRDVPGYVDVKGVSFVTNTVTVNGQTTYRKWEYFRDELSVGNSSLALWTNIITAATGQTSITGNVFVAKAPEQFSYDTDGNLTNDGRFNYAWDGENRLINLTSLTNAPAGSKVKLDFAYDAKGRRIQKIVSTNNGSIYVPQSTNNFLYDGWNLIAILNPQSSIIEAFMWGKDLSGSIQGAGGVGGLLEVSYYGTATTNCFPAFEGNGNIAALINAADGTTVANYEYGPFGEVIRSTGPMAKVNPIRFSTKYQDDESDLIYYGYRYYKPSTGTWPNRDPIGEHGGLNLYGFIGNNPVNQIDTLGLMKWEDLVAEWQRLDRIVRQKKCCCGQTTWLHASISGKASGATVSDTIQIDKGGCVDSITVLEYWWWDCVTAYSEGSGWKDGWYGGDPNAWHDYGWNAHGQAYSQTHVGSPTHGWADNNHWNWQAAVIYEYCAQDGTKHAKIALTDPLEWTWNGQSQSWADPH